MKISKLSVRNYRTLWDLELTFPSFYSAICGRNDSGKTNVVKAIRCVMKEDTPFKYYDDEPEFSLKKDFTKWVEKTQSSKSISVKIEFIISPQKDTGIYKFFVDYLDLGSQNQDNDLVLHVSVSHAEDIPLKVEVECRGQTFTDIKAQEILKRLQTSRTFLFHSSTDPRPPYVRGYRGILRDISEQFNIQLESSKKGVNRVLKKITREQQQEIENLLGRLKQKYKVGLTCPSLDLSYFPYNITLGDKKIDIELEEWGSGTKNRMHILLTIFRAKQVAESSASASKVTPIIVIEEPESFLHPLAQAEFGSILQHLSEEFGVQIIVTTHSPYLLSQERPESNILLERKTVRRQLRQTERIDTSGDRWMEPFSLSLGINNNEFKSWKDLFFNIKRAILLVEGDTDKEYFELLKDPMHGEKALSFDGDIYAYGGRDNLKNQTLLKFIKDKYYKIFITFDLDSESIVKDSLEAVGFEKNTTYMPIGIDEPGKRNIEGFLPNSVYTQVTSENPDLTRALSSDNKAEQKNAKQKLKELFLKKFKENSTPGDNFFGRFYTLTKIINKSLK